MPAAIPLLSPVDTVSHVAFRGERLVAEGSLATVVRVLHGWTPDQRRGVLLFETASGRKLDIDLRGSKAQIAERYPLVSSSAAAVVMEEASLEAKVPLVRKRGRPKLGVIGREVTLLPQHWEWLDTQRGGASATLRRLIDHAREELAAEEAMRAAQDRTNRFLTALASNLSGFEEAIRALYAGDQTRFNEQVNDWSIDLQRIAKQCARDAWRS